MRNWSAQVAFTTFVGLALANVSDAAPWSDQPAKLIVPFGAGGNTDLVARIAAQQLSARLGQRFIVENKLGAAGAIAAEFVAKAPPNGETFFLGTTPQISILPLISKINYDAQKDFDPVGNIANNPFVLGIHPSIPAKNLAEFIAYAKARPGQLNYGSSGVGTTGHLCAALLLSRAGLTLTHVPYKSGPQGVTDLVAGQIQMYFGTATDIVPHMRTGKLTVLGVSSEKRLGDLPDVPSIAETYPGFNLYSFNGVFAPTGTPRNIIEHIAREITAMVKDPEVIGQVRKIGLEPSGVVLGEFADAIKKETPFWAEAVKSAGIKAQ